MQNKLIHESRTCTPHSKKRSNPHSKIKNCPCFLSKIAFFYSSVWTTLLVVQCFCKVMEGKQRVLWYFNREKRANYTETKNQSPFHALREKHRELFWANSQWMRIMIKSQQELQRLNAESVKCNMIISCYTCISVRQVVFAFASWHFQQTPIGILRNSQ